MLKIFNLACFLGLLLNLNTVSVLAQLTGTTLLEKRGFRFELKGCSNLQNSDKPLKCEFLVENIEEKRKSLKFYAYNSRVIDAEGNVIAGSTVSLGGNRESREASISLLNGIPVKGSITFGRSPVGDIRLVDFHCYSLPSKFNVEFPFSN